MKIILFISIILCIAKYGTAQDLNYDGYIKVADSLFQMRSYKLAAVNYSNAFKTNNWRGTIEHRYQATRAWSMASELDSAFYHLNKIAISGNYVNYERLIAEPALKKLHKDKRWTPITKMIDASQLLAEPKLDRKLALVLDSIHTNDQQYRMQLINGRKGSGIPLKNNEELLQQIKYHDSLNLAKVIRIIDERGWLSADIIGYNGNNALFLVIQHSNLPTMLKYLPIIKDAVTKGNAKASSLAMLEDRINTLQNKKQTYGSQLFTDPNTGKSNLLPLVDPDHVDERRAQVGLGPIAKYLQQFGIIWKPTDYK